MEQLLHELSATLLNLPSEHPLIVGIDGKDASGKTTFANILGEHLSRMTDREIVRVSLDNFFNPRSVRSQQKDQARGCYEDTFDDAGIVQYLLDPVRSESLTYAEKIFDYATDMAVPVKMKPLAADAIVVVDGVFLQKPLFRVYWDYVVLLEVDNEVAIERGSVRDTTRIGDVRSAREKYINRYMASQKLYYDECDPLRRADMVIDNTDYNQPRVVQG